MWNGDYVTQSGSYVVISEVKKCLFGAASRRRYLHLQPAFASPADAIIIFLRRSSPTYLSLPESDEQQRDQGRESRGSRSQRRLHDRARNQVSSAPWLKGARSHLQYCIAESLRTCATSAVRTQRRRGGDCRSATSTSHLCVVSRC